MIDVPLGPVNHYDVRNESRDNLETIITLAATADGC